MKARDMRHTLAPFAIPSPERQKILRRNRSILHRKQLDAVPNWSNLRTRFSIGQLPTLEAGET